MGELWRKIIETGGATSYGTAASLITLLVTARYLGPDGRGSVAAVSAWATLFATLGCFSLGQVAVHRGAGRDPRAWLPAAVGVITAVIFVVTIGTWAAIGLLCLRTGAAVFRNVSAAEVVLGFLPLPLLMWNESSRYLLYGLNSFRTANVASILSSSVAVGGIAVFVVALGWGVQGALLSVVCSSAASATVTAMHLRRYLDAFEVRWTVVKPFLASAFQLHLNAVGTYLFTQASVVILNHYRSLEEVGFYQLAIQLLNVSLVLATAVSAVAYGLVSHDGPDVAWTRQRRLLVQSVAASVALVIAAYVAAPMGVRLVGGPEFAPAIPLFRAVVMALVGGTFSAVMASQWIGRGLFWQASLLTVTVGIISVSLDFALVPLYGMYGAVVSTLVTYAISVLGNGFMAGWVELRWRHYVRDAAALSPLRTAAEGTP